MKLAIFDLDNTLLNGDSDYAWGNFLVSKGIVEAQYYQKENDRFYQEYNNKTLDIVEYQHFVLKPLIAMDIATRELLHQQFMDSVVATMLQEKAKQLIDQHRKQGDTLLVITATNRFITAPIVERLGIDHLLATEAEVVDNQFTGKMTGIPCFQEGKIERLEQWLNNQENTLAHSTFYSDSINDAPLLEYVDRAVAVDPDKSLRKLAKEKGWRIISLRD